MAAKKKATSSKIKAVNTKRGAKMGAVRAFGSKMRASSGALGGGVGGKGGGD